MIWFDWDLGIDISRDALQQDSISLCSLYLPFHHINGLTLVNYNSDYIWQFLSSFSITVYMHFCVYDIPFLNTVSQLNCRIILILSSLAVWVPIEIFMGISMWSITESTVEVNPVIIIVVKLWSQAISNTSFRLLKDIHAF